MIIFDKLINWNLDERTDETGAQISQIFRHGVHHFHESRLANNGGIWRPAGFEYRLKISITLDDLTIDR